MRIGIYAPIMASDRGYERNVSGHIQVPVHSARLLSEAGHEVHLITNRYGSQHTLPECVPADLPMHLVHDGRRRPERRRGGPPAGGIRPLGVLIQMRQMKRIIHRERLEIVHIFGFHRSAVLGGCLRALGTRPPVVATLLGGNLPDRLATPSRFLSNRLAAIVTATEYVAGRCTRLGLRTKVIRHGVVRDFTAELDDASPRRRHRVLYWREPTRNNGADLCVATFDRLAPEFPEVGFDFAIRPVCGREVPGIAELAARHENVHVHHFPYRDGPGLPELIAESLLVVLPFRRLTIDPQLAIAESFAAGVPVITSGINSNAEIVEHGKTGMVLPVGEPDPIVEAVRALLRDRAHLLEMGHCAATSVAERCTYVDELLGPTGRSQSVSEETEASTCVRARHRRTQRKADLELDIGVTSCRDTITTYRDFLQTDPPLKRLLAALRDTAVGALSLGRTVPATGSWIRFPYYHHVFEDEREGFTAHLRFMRNHGEFIGIDEAIDMLTSEEPLDGRFFCISFDDGLRNCLKNALPILSALQAPAAFFIATDYVGASAKTAPELCRRFFDGRPLMLDFLTWDDCRAMVEAGMTFGSHTASHAHLIDCTREQVEQEMRRSREAIEEQLGRSCEHFCCPNGQPGVDFLVEQDPALAETVGYRSFLTTRRGSVHRRPSPYMLERDKMIAAWNVSQLRYFFSR